MTKASRLIEALSNVGHKMDGAKDIETMKFLLRGRKAIVAALEASRPTVSEPLRFTEVERQIVRDMNTAPYRFTGLTDDGMACYDA